MNIKTRFDEHFNEICSLNIPYVALAIQGSQNYKMDYEESDVDTKCIVVPTFNDIVLAKTPVSYTHIRANNEHIDIKDIRSMVQCWKKQNVNFVEFLYAQHMTINPFFKYEMDYLIQNRDEVASYNNYAGITCMVGMIYEKGMALEHPYPATISKIEKDGFDGKQLSHMIRMTEFIERFYFNHEHYADCLISNSHDLQMKAKLNQMTLEEARELARFYNVKAKTLRETYMKEFPLVINANAEYILEKFIIDCIRKSMTHEVFNI